jgi:hypothetical protein
MQKHLRALLALKAIGLVHEIKGCVRRIRYYKSTTESIYRQNPELRQKVVLVGRWVGRLRRCHEQEMKERNGLAIAGRRLRNTGCNAFMYKCMELVRLFEESQLVLRDANDGTYNGSAIQLHWDVHQAGPAVYLRVQAGPNNYWRDCGNATYYVTQHFTNKILDVTLRG